MPLQWRDVWVKERAEVKSDYSRTEYFRGNRRRFGTDDTFSKIIQVNETDVYVLGGN